MKERLDSWSAHFGPLLGYCDHQVHKFMNRLLREYDVTPMQCRTLVFLRDVKDEVNQKTLEKFLMVKPSTVNGIVDRLEEKGMLRRTTSREDGRCRILVLTEAGMRFYDNFLAAEQQVNERLECGFSEEERETLIGLLTRLARNLTEEEINPC